jgi:hypothetical protein
MSTPEEIAAKLDPPQNIKGSKLTTWVMDQIGRTDITLGLSVVALIIEKRQMDFAMNSIRKLKFNNPCDIIREVKTIADEVEVENFDKFVTCVLVKYAEEFKNSEIELMLEHNLVKHIRPHDSSTGTGCWPCTPRLRHR